MSATFYTLLTKFGQAAVANATALNTPVNLTKMAVGDGGGAATTPKENQTTLIAQKYIANINQLTIDTSNPNYLIAEMIVPTTVGGWYVREVGIFDAAGNLFAVANFPETYKPQLAEGSGRDLVIRIVIQVSNASAVTLLVDPAITLASQSWVINNYTSKTKISGGSKNQVLAKKTNTDQDFGWVNPVDIIDTATTEKKGLTTLTSTVSDDETKAATPKAILSISQGRLLNIQRFTVSGLYTPTVGTKKVVIRGVGGGGGGGGCPLTTSNQQSTSGGGQSGCYAEITLESLLSSYAITIGQGGTAGAKTPTPGGGGGTTIMAGVITIPGGAGGYAGAAVSPTISVGGVSNGNTFPTVLAGTIRALLPAASGQPALILGSSTNQAKGGTGGSSPLGIGGQGGLGGAPGSSGVGFGAGGGGCSQLASNAGDVGGAGSNGYLEIWEFA